MTFRRFPYGPSIRPGRMRAASFGHAGAGGKRGISVWICGEVPRRGAEITQISCNKIANVESEGRFVRFSYNADEVDVDSICLWLPTNAAADQFVAVITANAIVFIATLIAGAEWITPVGKMQITWGSNFAPYTTDGEW